jgi:hypothetical protein
MGIFQWVESWAPPRCGVGVVLYISISHLFMVRYDFGKDTNMKAELFAMWALLFLVNMLNMWKVQVLGDSRVEIN